LQETAESLSLRSHVKHDALSLEPEDDPMQGSAADLKQSLFAVDAVELEGAPPVDAGRISAPICQQSASSSLSDEKGMVKPDLPVFIEACAGCGVLSQTVKARGFKVLPIDCARNRHKPKCKIFELDLSQPHAIALLKRVCRDVDVLCVHIALPCGTCSKARGIPLPNGRPGPQPLRDWNHLYGLPTISGTDAEKVEAANRLYLAIAELIEFLEEHGVAWTIENPGNSWLWELPCMAFAIAHAKFYHLHACAYGGTRMKDTAFLANRDEFHILSRFCDGSHDHEGWGYDAELGIFNTAKEAEYPKLLCEAYADVLITLAQQKGHSFFSPAMDDAAIKPQQQRPGRKVPQLIPEFLTVVAILVDEIPPTNDKQCLLQSIGQAPAGAKLLRTEEKRGKFLCVFGIYRSMHDFTQLARQLWHPYDELLNLPDELIICLFTTLRASMEDLTKRRIRTLQRWTEMAQRCAEDERALQESLDPQIRNVLKGKRLVLLEKLAEEVEWPDKMVHTELRQGFMLTGYAPPTGIFRTELKPAKLDKAQLMKDAKFLRPLILGKLRRHTTENEDEQTLFDITLEEAQVKGWLQGPFSPEQITEQQKGVWLPVRRFGIWQKGKFRPIDDMKENHLNDCFSTCDKIDLHAMDHVLWSLCISIKFRMFHESMSFRLSDGTVLTAEAHPSWRLQPPSFKITAFDLASAYKQLPLNPKEYNCTVVSLRSPKENAVKCFYMRTLPFGSIASVVHFNRISRLLWRLGLALGILWGNYFDDFPCVTHVAHATSTMACVQGLFKLLGFAFAEDKLLPFEDHAEMLGVLVNSIVIAFRLWGHLFERQKVLIFGDNWAANDVFIKGTSSVKAWRTLLLELEKLDDAIGALTWMARVPSSSNIADPPSRGSLDELKAFKPKIETHIQCPVTKHVLNVFLKS